MEDIIITVGPFAQGFCLGGSGGVVACILAAWGMIAYSKKQQRDKLAAQFEQVAQGGNDENLTT